MLTPDMTKKDFGYRRYCPLDPEDSSRARLGQQKKQSSQRNSPRLVNQVSLHGRALAVPVQQDMMCFELYIVALPPVSQHFN